MTDKYVKENNLNEGHWYPSATELGNGDIISYGGLDQVGQAATDIEYFKYDKPPDRLHAGQPGPTASGCPRPTSTAITRATPTDGLFWGLYPSMILTQKGELFYTGSHVFGDNETPVGEAVHPPGHRAGPASSTSPTSSSPVPGPT